MTYSRIGFGFTLVSIAILLGMCSMSLVRADEVIGPLRVLDRTPEANNYLNLTSNETFMEIFAREVNMLNLSGAYRPYEEVTRLVVNDSLGMNLTWNNNSVYFKFYTVNQSGYKEYFSDKSQQQLLDLQFSTFSDSGYGLYYYTHNLTTNLSVQPSKFGYEIIAMNVSCERRNKALICGDQMIDFSQAIDTQNLVINITNQSVEFSGANLSYIDPTITLDRFSVWSSWCLAFYTDTNEYVSGSECGANDQIRWGVDERSSYEILYRSYVAFTVSSLGASWNLSQVRFRWYNYDINAGGNDDNDLAANRIIENCASDWSPDTQAESGEVYNCIAGSNYNVESNPVDGGFNTLNLNAAGVNPMVQLHDDIVSGRRFFVGLKRNTESTSDEGYGMILNQDHVNGPSLIVDYTIPDTTAPATAASATSPPGGPSYSFGSNTTNEVRVSLSCSDSGGNPVSGCSLTKYCTDTSNSCTPISTYSSPFTISTEGTSYIRYQSRDNAGNLESVQSRTIIIDRNYPDNVAVYVHGTNVWSYAGELRTTETTSNFVEALNGALDNCTADSLGYCTIPIVIHSDHTGGLNVSNINVRFNIGGYLWNASGLAQLSTYLVRLYASDGLYNSSIDQSDGDFSIGSDTIAPRISFVNATPVNSSTVNRSTIVANLSSLDQSAHYVLLDSDRSNVIWLRMDDVNASGDPVDLTTYTNNATRLNGASLTTNGMFGSAFAFDGVNDILKISDSSSLTTNDLTMAAWVRSYGTSGIQLIMEQLRQNSTGKTRGIYIANDNTLHFFGAWEGDGQDDSSNYTIRDGQWHHVAVTRSDLDNRRIFYVDGIERARFNDTQTGINNPDMPFWIGGRGDNNQFFFNGSIDEVIVSNRAWAATEIAALYNASTSQYVTSFDDMTEGSHTLKGYAVDSFARLNSTEERVFTVALSLNITHLDLVYQNATERVFRFIINNTRASSTSGIAWNLSIGQGSIISQQNFTLQGGESALVYVYYNYTVSGNYTVKAHAYSSNYSDKRSIQIRV